MRLWEEVFGVRIYCDEIIKGGQQEEVTGQGNPS